MSEGEHSDRRVDRDALVAERDFLLTSIDDLEAEYEAGDLDEADYRTLRDGYVARTAAILRHLDPADQPSTGPGDQPSTAPKEQPDTGPGDQPSTAPKEQPSTGPGDQPNTGPGDQPSTAPKEQPGTGPGDQPGTGPGDQPDTAPKDQPNTTAGLVTAAEPNHAARRAGIGWKRRVGTFVGVAAVAVIAGLALAQAAGYRSPSDAGSGGIRQSTASRLAEAETLGAEGRWEEALDLYDDVLEDDPANAEALAYKGWVLNTQFGDADQANDYLAEAVAADPTYADARVFSALLARSRGDYQAAREHLVAFDEIDSVPAQMTMLVDNAGLRSEVLAELYLDEFDQDGAVTVDGRFPLDESANAAVVLDSRGDVVAAIATFDAVLEADPTNRIARVGLGRRLGATPELVASSPRLAERGLGLLDDAVDADPNDAEARAYRALARAVQGDEVGARDDLTVLDESQTLPEGLEPIVAEVHAWLDQ